MKFWKCCACLLFFVSHHALGVITVKYSGTLPRSVSAQGYFDLDVEILDVVPSNRDIPGMFSRLTVILTDVSAGGGEITPLTENYSVIQRSDPSEEQDTTTFNYNYKVFLRISEGSSDFDDILTSKKINIRIKYDDEKTTAHQTFDGATVGLELQTAIANAAPAIEVKPGHKLIKADLTIEDTIAYTNEKQITPTGATLIAIEQGVGNFAFNGYRHEPDNDEDANGEFCSYSDLEEDGTCIDCGEEGVTDQNYYMDLNDLKSMGGVRIVNVPQGQKTGIVSGLDPDKSYNVFAIYQPDGAVRSSCTLASPTQNETMSEYNGEPEADLTEAYCFIATAAYGSSNHWAVKILREFRDRFLKKTTVGRQFVDFYYRNSPNLANVIDNSKVLQGLTMVALMPLVFSALLMNFSVREPTMIAMIMICGVLGYLCYKRWSGRLMKGAK